MLAAYRDIENTELDAHLEQCAECRAVLAQQNIVGDKIRLLPTLEPASDASDKLMRALAAEHANFLQRSSHTHASSASSVPDFLKPYMKEQTYTAAQRRNRLTTFSTAETGPLPMLQARRKKRIAPMGQFAVLGLAASFLMVFLIGGLISVLIIASHGSNNLSSPASSIAIAPPSLVAPVSYTTTTDYPHISSAVATREHIYYSAYGDGNMQWMIEQIDNSAKNATSIPLLAKGSENPVFVLAASQNWLIWLQFDTPQRGSQTHVIGHTGTTSLTRHWSLNALPLSTSHTGTQSFEQSITLEQGTFDTATVPSWVYTPVQGLDFMQQDTLLTATVNAKGDAQVTRYQLSTAQATTATTLATTNNGHIFTSPTATADGSRIFWSEEWFTDDMQPHSNVWLQQTTQTLTHSSNAWRPSIMVDKQLFLANEVSFHPQVINDTLFLLTTSDSLTQTSRKPDATSTPTQSAQGTATPVSTAPVIPRFTNVYAPQIDESIHGTLLAYALDDSAANPTILSNDSTAAAPQGGTRFLLWQNSNGYQMYDAVAKSPVVVKNNTGSAAFLTVNGDTAVWIAAENPAAPSTGTSQTATFSMFNWPA